MSYNLGKPIEWGEFKALPNEIQEEYLIGLQKKYSVTATDIAKMFGVKPLTVTRHVASKELNVSFHRGRSMSAEQRTEFAKFLSGDTAREDDLATEDLNKITSDESATAEGGVVAMKMNGVSLSFSGRIDVDAIANSLRHILGTGAVGRIQIICDIE